MTDPYKNKNPWKRPGDEDIRSPWGGNTGGGQEPPGLDEMLRQAQERLRRILPRPLRAGGALGLIALAAFALWMASGFYIVNPGEYAVIQRFGAWSRTQDQPGLGYRLPAPIERATILNVEEIRVLAIGFAQGYAQGTAGRRDVPEESLMLTADRNIVDLDLNIQWNIKSAEDFLFSIRDQENTIKKVAESAVREVVGQMEMFQIITTGRAALAERTRAILQENLDRYKSGVSIKQVLIDRAEVHPDVQSAFQDVQSAKQDAEDVQNRADAYREDILPRARGLAIQMKQEAEGYAQTAVARASGDAQRFDAVYEAYLSGQDVTKERIYIETMESVLRNATKIILDGKAGGGAVPYLPLNELPAAPKKAESPSPQSEEKTQ